MALPPFLTSIIDWLRAGYPEGVPEHDYIPLFALLARKLSDDEVAAIAGELASNAEPASAQAVLDAIAAVTHESPSEGDIARVSARLAAGGWPLAAPVRHTSTG